VRALWKVLRTHRDFRYLIGAGLISLTGDNILGVGLAFFVYDLTGSTLASAATLLSVYVPSILLSSLAGVFVDRWNRKTTMIASNLILAAGLTPLLLVSGRDDVWIVYVVAAFEGIVELFFDPAEQAMLPRLVSDSNLTTANAVNGQVRNLSRLVGSTLGGVVIATGGITVLAIVDAGTFVASAALIARIRTDGRPEPTKSEQAEVRVSPSRLRALADEWRAGLRLAVSQPVLRVILIFTFIAMLGEGIMGTLFVPFVRDVLHGSGEDYGVVSGVQAVGGVAGGFVAGGLGQRRSPVRMFGVGCIVFGFIDLAMFLYPLVYVAVWPAVMCMIVVGLPGAVLMAGYNTLLQRNTADAFRGRVLGALGVVRGTAVVLGTVAAGFLGETLPIVAVISYQGVGYMTAGVVILILLRNWIAQTRPSAVDAGDDGAVDADGSLEVPATPTQNL
jgi:Na+/melibiose symporter-like transporter